MAQLPEKDELSWTKKQLLAKLDVCMGGRVAEELIFGQDNITSGEYMHSGYQSSCLKKTKTIILR